MARKRIAPKPSTALTASTAAADATRVNLPEWTVSELSSALKKTVEDAYGYVRVRGEVSGYRGPHSSGHCYFALKDENAKIEAVIWKGVFGRMRIKPEDGMEVVASGKLTTYPGQSKYQIVVESLAPAGLGALMALMEERKKKLAAEGLFDEARKQLLPYLPEVIGVITSPTGAVIRDILHRLADRFPRRVLVWPVRVQGEGSAEEVAAAIHGFNALPAHGPIPKPDLLIVARGGGSLEDLWSFNEEIVVRAAAESMIPLMSAVGHETDVTLIDFAADRRAPTPTAAAEIAVPVRAELLAEIDDLARRQRGAWMRGIDGLRTELRAAMRALPTADTLLAIPRQRLDVAADRLPRALRANAQVHRTQFTRIAGPLTPRMLRSLIERRRERYVSIQQRLGAARVAYLAARRTQIERARERVIGFQERTMRAMMTLLQQRSARIDRAGQLLNALSHRGVLARGFVLVRDLQGHPLRTVAAVSPGMRVDIEFADGQVRALTEDARGAAPSEAPARPRDKRGDKGQGSLF